MHVFGPVARGDADEQSDVDFLVDTKPGYSLFDLGGLQYELEQLLGCPVDVGGRAQPQGFGFAIVSCERSWSSERSHGTVVGHP